MNSNQTQLLILQNFDIRPWLSEAEAGAHCFAAVIANETGSKLAVAGFAIQLQPYYRMSSEGQSEENPKKKMRSKREKYAKVSLKTKIIFFQKVVHEQGDLREISKKLGIKYSTAKTLVRNYKSFPEETNQKLVRSVCEDFDCKLIAIKRCSYRLIDERTQPGDSSVRLKFAAGGQKAAQIQIICNLISCQNRF